MTAKLIIVVCSVLGLPEKWYIGRSQYPHFEEKPAVPSKALNNKYVSFAANFWGCLSQVVERYMKIRTNDFVHTKSTKSVRRFLPTLDTLGNSCSAGQLKVNTEAAKGTPGNFTIEWKGENPNEIVCAGRSPISVRDVLANPDDHSDLVLIELLSLADNYKRKAISFRCAQSTKDWRNFCLDQLAKGAGVLHKFVNRPNALPPVPLFKVGDAAKTPLDAVRNEALLWSKI